MLTPYLLMTIDMTKSGRPIAPHLRSKIRSNRSTIAPVDKKEDADHNVDADAGVDSKVERPSAKRYRVIVIAGVRHKALWNSSKRPTLRDLISLAQGSFQFDEGTLVHGFRYALEKVITITTNAQLEQLLNAGRVLLLHVATIFSSGSPVASSLSEGKITEAKNLLDNGVVGNGDMALQSALLGRQIEMAKQLVDGQKAKLSAQCLKTCDDALLDQDREFVAWLSQHVHASKDVCNSPELVDTRTGLALQRELKLTGDRCSFAVGERAWHLDLHAVVKVTRKNFSTTDRKWRYDVEKISVVPDPRLFYASASSLLKICPTCDPRKEKESIKIVASKEDPLFCWVLLAVLLCVGLLFGVRLWMNPAVPERACWVVQEQCRNGANGLYRTGLVYRYQVEQEVHNRFLDGHGRAINESWSYLSTGCHLAAEWAHIRCNNSVTDSTVSVDVKGSDVYFATVAPHYEKRFPDWNKEMEILDVPPKVRQNYVMLLSTWANYSQWNGDAGALIELGLPSQLAHALSSQVTPTPDDLGKDVSFVRSDTVPSWKRKFRLVHNLTASPHLDISTHFRTATMDECAHRCKLESRCVLFTYTHHTCVFKAKPNETPYTFHPDTVLGIRYAY